MHGAGLPSFLPSSLQFSLFLSVSLSPSLEPVAHSGEISTLKRKQVGEGDKLGVWN